MYLCTEKKLEPVKIIKYGKNQKYKKNFGLCSKLLFRCGFCANSWKEEQTITKGRFVHEAKRWTL